MSSKKKRMLKDANNFIYHLRDESKVKAHWRCIEYRKTARCPATASVCVKTGTMLSLSNDHNHSNNLAKSKAKQMEASMLDNARKNPSITTRTVLKNLASDLNVEGTFVTSTMSNKTTLARKIRRVRANEMARPALPKTVQDLFSMPDAYTMATDGTKFLATVEYVDKDETSAFLLFISNHGKDVLRSYDVIQCDGSFQTCPKPFEQIYFVFGCAPSGKIIPAAFSLLPNKSTTTYTALFAAIEKLYSNEC